jgi:hypothetical protein
MSAESDLKHQRAATTLASDAAVWLRRNRSIAAMGDGDEPLAVHDYGPDVPWIWYTQLIQGPNIKFGHLVMRPGCYRHAYAAVSDFQTDDGVHWVLCGASDHPLNRDAPLAVHVQMHNLVHEATHCIDFTRSGHKPRAFQAEDIRDLRRRYYDRPHELNAFFHQGLYLFMRDLEMVKASLSRYEPDDSAGRRQHLLHTLYSDAYWCIRFMGSLSRCNRKRVIKRVFRLFEILLPATTSRAILGMTVS